MHTGAITQYIDVAQLALYGFWIFFAGLIYYLRSEDKREGYPLESDIPNRVAQGFPPIPRPKTFLLQHGETRVVPASAMKQSIAAVPTSDHPGAPLQPTGNPMLDCVGPGAYANRADQPDVTVDGLPKIVPMRVATEFHVESRDPDPRGMEVIGADGGVGGVVRDIWVDRSETIIRYLEVEVLTPAGTSRVLLPMNFSRIHGRRRQVQVKSILAEHFASVPALRNPDQVTFLEEERIVAYYGAGHLYAKPSRLGPWL
jgi:photosynthetic reaction center H subunit